MPFTSFLKLSFSDIVASTKSLISFALWSADILSGACCATKSVALERAIISKRKSKSTSLNSARLLASLLKRFIDFTFCPAVPTPNRTLPKTPPTKLSRNSSRLKRFETSPQNGLSLESASEKTKDLKPTSATYCPVSSNPPATAFNPVLFQNPGLLIMPRTSRGLVTFLRNFPKSSAASLACFFINFFAVFL